MSALHTKGPWHVGMESDWSIDTDGENSFVHIGPDNGDPVAIAVVGSAWDQDDELDANARLIAAAPDMLEALKRLERWFDTDEELLLSMTGPERADHERQVAMIRAAIARATGEAKP